jgi:RND family efflux transporter MFP subunit
MTSKQNDSIESTQIKEDLAETANLRMKFPRTALIVGAIIIFVAAGLIPRLLQRAALAKETRELAVPKVSVVMPAPGKAGAGLILPADIQPWVEAPIYARATGYLKRWLVDIGTNVKAGQLLAVIETPDLDQEHDQARHQLTESEASLSLAKITAARYAELVKTASVSEQDNAEKQGDLALKTAGVSAARANVRRLEYLKSFSHVTAPFAGTITARNCDIGELIAAGNSKELFRLSQTNKLRIYVRVPQTNALGIKPDQTAELMIPEMPDHPFSAKVVRTAGQISDDSRTLLTELEVDNKQGKILSGSFGQVKFINTKSESTLTLPSISVMFGAEGPHVALVTPDGKIELRNVKLGRNFGPTIEILAGVGINDRVVSNPSESLTNGVTVSIVALANNKKGGLK